MDKTPEAPGWMNSPEPSDHSEHPERSGSWAFQLALCLLGPLFFLSLFLLVLAPLPLLYLHVGTPQVHRGRLWTALALVIGLALTFAIHGWLWGSLSFFLFASLPAFVLGEALLRKVGPERAVLGAMLAVVVASCFSAWAITQSRGQETLPTLQRAAESLLKERVEKLLAQDSEQIPENARTDLQSLKDNPGEFLAEMPGAAASLLLLLCALPCIAMIRWNPKGFLRRMGIPRDFLRRWRTPDWFVWSAILCAVGWLVEEKTINAFASNAQKPVVLIYFFQGMSILAYFLDSLRLRGPFRVVFYGVAGILLTPMVVSFGFFDLWFNFRGRNRARDEEKDEEKQQ